MIYTCYHVYYIHVLARVYMHVHAHYWQRCLPMVTVIPRPWWCWDVILGFVFQYKMMSLIPLQCNALNPDPFLRFSFQRNWSPYKGVEGLHSFTLAWLSKMRRDSINLNQTLIRQRKLFINSICQILWRSDHKVLAKMVILTETLLRFSGFFFLKGQTRAKNVWKSKIMEFLLITRAMSLASNY